MDVSLATGKFDCFNMKVCESREQFGQGLLERITIIYKRSNGVPPVFKLLAPYFPVILSQNPLHRYTIVRDNIIASTHGRKEPRRAPGLTCEISL